MLSLLGLFTLLLAGLLALVLWQAARSETHRIDALIGDEMAALAADRLDDILSVVQTRIAGDSRHLAFAGLFTPQGQAIAGNLWRLPDDLAIDGVVRPVQASLHDAPAGGHPGGDRIENGRAVAQRLPGGQILVIGRETRSDQAFGTVVVRDLALAAIPILFLVTALGAMMGLRTQRRVRILHAALERIMGGHLNQRLAVRDTGPAGWRRGGDELDRLAVTVNRMLDEIERLLLEIKATGDDIAHDLRTPLTRVRARLERALRSSLGPQDLEEAIGRSIGGLDQALTVITALLRLRDLEYGRRLTGFGQVDLTEILTLIEDLYQPVAEEKDITLRIAADRPLVVRGDRDLLMEAVGNLVDNAIKFTAPGGRVEMGVSMQDGGARLTVRDTGPGIAPQERDLVFTRFYRSDRTRQSEGTGLGLSLVAAIAKLHGAEVSVCDAQPGCAISLGFRG